MQSSTFHTVNEVDVHGLVERLGRPLQLARQRKVAEHEVDVLGR